MRITARLVVLWTLSTERWLCRGNVINCRVSGAVDATCDVAPFPPTRRQMMPPHWFSRVYESGPRPASRGGAVLSQLIHSCTSFIFCWVTDSLSHCAAVPGRCALVIQLAILGQIIRLEVLYFIGLSSWLCPSLQTGRLEGDILFIWDFRVCFLFKMYYEKQFQASELNRVRFIGLNM